jgi:demethylmenaquinone methyltransferase/2-methoxy-6-polyprenyl-1,4-benzoquinol methylase
MIRDGSGEMFDAIAGRYDLANRVLSLGIDKRWRRIALASLGPLAGARALDVATGTADLAIAMARRGAEVVGLDPSAGMLAVGARKLGPLAARVKLLRGTAETLPFPDRSFDAVTIAFGIRNVPDRRRALAEMARVTRAGGRVAVLELGEPPGGLLGPLARFHIRSVVPRLGAWLSRAHEYRYLERSIAAFPPPAEFAALMSGAGLRVLEVRPLTFGVCNLYVGEPAMTDEGGRGDVWSEGAPPRGASRAGRARPSEDVAREAAEEKFK